MAQDNQTSASAKKISTYITMIVAIVMVLAVIALLLAVSLYYTGTTASRFSSLGENIVIGNATPSHIQALFSWSPSFPETNQAVSFTSASYLNGTITNYKWDFGDRNVTEGNYPVITHSYSANGAYTVTLSVNSSGGVSSISENVTIGYSAQSSLQAPFVWSPNHPGVDQTIFFNTASSLAHASISNYQWNFGDGNTTSGLYSTITHSYSANGTYAVTLTVTAPNRTAQASDYLAAGVLAIIGLIALTMSSFTFFQARRQVAEMKIEIPKVMTTIECRKCGTKTVREFQRGDFVFKELDACPKCPGEKQVITAIYKEVKEKEKTYAV